MEVIDTKDLKKALHHARCAVQKLEIATLYPNAADVFYDDVDREIRHELWQAYKETI